jgi:Leucine-rich repeat (LRR) protein
MAQYVPHGGKAVKCCLHGNNGFYIPDTMGADGCESRALKGLRLPNCSLTGKLPESISKLPDLEEIDLRNNALHGSLPAALLSCKQLMRINLGANKLNGPFPVSVLSKMKSLRELRVPWNHFTGRFEDIVAKLPAAIRILDLGANRIEGSIPTYLNRLEKLRELYLYKNNFESEIPEESFAYCRFLRVISIECNHFHGALPLDMLEMKVLKLLYTSNNHFEGMSEFNKAMTKKFLKEPETTFEHLLVPQTPKSVAGVVERFSN